MERKSESATYTHVTNLFLCPTSRIILRTCLEDGSCPLLSPDSLFPQEMSR
jgi:hypothetical protein